MRRSAVSLLLGLLGTAAVAVAAPRAWAEGDAQDFKDNCKACHTIGGGRTVGPDLKNVHVRQPDTEWLVAFIVNPAEKIASGDAYAAKMLAAHNNVVMPPVPGMNPRRARQLLELIKAESALEKSQFFSSGPSDRPFTGADLARGRSLFVGQAAQAGGGPACLACHQAGTAAPFGPGVLGPDLTDVWTRLGGRKALGAWLSGPATPTMKPLFTRHPLDPEQDVLPLLAFFEDVGRQGAAPDPTPSRLTYVLLGAAGAAVLLVLMDFAWRRRFRGVRSRLVGGRA